MTMTLAIPVLAQEPSEAREVPQPGSNDHGERQTNEFKHRAEDWVPGRKNRDRSGRSEFNKRPERAEWTEEQRKKHQERKYQFMEKSLSEIGVNDED